jgi:hypothetical protein
MNIHGMIAAAGSHDAELARLTAFATARPGAYERRVLLLAVLGYVYLVAAVVVILGLAVAFGFFLFWWRGEGHPVGIFAGLWLALGTGLLAIVQAFTITPPAPTGLRIGRAESPALFDLIDEIRARVHAPAIDEVVLRADTHAECHQRLRFGLVGPTSRYLVLGLPALLGTTPDELRAILAHEIGHLSTESGRTRAWTYGVRQSWMHLLSTLHERRSITRRIFAVIFGWYMNRFARYSFVLARQFELRADREAAALCGSELVGESLVRLASLNHLIGRRLSLTSGLDAIVRGAPATRSRELLRTPPTEEELRRALNAALASDDEGDDVHPPLSDRLAALGVEPRLFEARGGSAAERYFGNAVDELCARVDDEWRRETGIGAGGPTSLEQSIKTMAADVEVASTRPIADLTTDELRRRADMTHAMSGALAALPLYEALVARDDAAGHLGVAHIRLAQGDESGLTSVDRAIELDRSVRLEAAELARDFLVEAGRTQETERYDRIRDEAVEEMSADAAMRGSVSTADELSAPDLDRATASSLAETLARVKPIARAYLVRKIVPEQPDVHVYFLGLVYGTRWFLGTDQKDIDSLTGRIHEAVSQISHDVTVVIINRYAGRKKFEETPNALLFVRPPESWPRQILPRWGARAQTLALALGILYTAMYAYLVANIGPEYNAVAGPIVLAPLVASVLALFWARRGDDAARRIAGLAGVGGLIGAVAGAYLAEQEWTYVFIPLLALGLFRPPANAPPIRAALVVAVAVLAGLGLRLFAHLVLVG